MSHDAKPDTNAVTPERAEPHPPLTPAARRALAEADERRKAAAAAAAGKEQAKEHGGRDGPDPVRFGDWEKGGIISDF